MLIATLIPRPVCAEKDSLVTPSCSACHLLDLLLAILDVELTATVNMHHQTDVSVTRDLPEIHTLVAKHWNIRPVQAFSVVSILLVQSPLVCPNVSVVKATLEILTVVVMIWMSVQLMYVVSMQFVLTYLEAMIADVNLILLEIPLKLVQLSPRKKSMTSVTVFTVDLMLSATLASAFVLLDLRVTIQMTQL